MKAERINQDQIRFTIDANDLSARNLRVSELAYGSKKTQALFDDMMKQAMEMFGIDFSEKPLMIEAIPLSDDKLSVTVTKVEGMAEVGALIGANLPGANLPGGYNQGKDPFQGNNDPLKNPLGGPAANASQAKAEGRKDEGPAANFPMAEVAMQMGNMGAVEPVVYFFKSMETLLKVAADVPEKFTFKNRLVRDVGNGCYYLICEFKNIGPKTRHLVAMLSQYSDEWYVGQHIALMADEHSKKVFAANALQKLGKVQRSC